MRSARALLNRYGRKSVPTWGVVRDGREGEGNQLPLFWCLSPHVSLLFHHDVMVVSEEQMSNHRKFLTLVSKIQGPL